MAETIKISALTEISSGALDDTSILPVVDGGTTYKLPISKLKAFVGDSFATDAELSAQISSVNSTISGLTTTEISEGTRLYYTDARVKTKLNTEGIISGSAQITITESQISDLTHYTDADVLDYINQLEIVSCSIVTELPNGLISSSQQVIDYLPEGTISGSQQISGLGFTTTDSVNSTISSTVNSSYIKNRLPENTISSSQQVTNYLPENTISSSQQVTDYLPEGIISSSAQLPIGIISGSEQITDLGFITESVATTLPQGVVSSSQQIEDLGFLTESAGIISSSQQVIDYLPEGIVSSSQQVTDYLPEGIISGSQQITDLGFIEDLPQNLISGSAQISALGFLVAVPEPVLPTGLVSSSQQVIDYLPEGIVSGSQQVIDYLPEGIVSGSSQVSYPNLSNIPAGIVSGSSQVTPLLPSGVISGSSQIQNLGFISSLPTGVISSSQQVIDYLPTDLVSSSQQVKDLLPQGTISSSNQLPTYLTEGDFSTVSQSFSQRITDFESIEIISQSSQVDYQNIQNQLQFVSGDGIFVSQSTEEVTISISTLSYNSLTSIPQNIVSSSDQIANLNFVNDSDLNSADGIKTLTVPNNTTITSFAATFLDDTDAAGVKTTLGIQELDYATTGSNTFVGQQQINANLIVSGSTNVGQVLQLASLDTLPGGVTGQLAVSASGGLHKLYFYDGGLWREVAFA